MNDDELVLHMEALLRMIGFLVHKYGDDGRIVIGKEEWLAADYRARHLMQDDTMYLYSVDVSPANEEQRP